MYYEMGGECGTYEVQESWLQGFVVETCEKQTTWKTQG